MYTAQITKDRIKLLCKIKKVNLEDLQEECGLGINAVRQINDTKGMASFSLAKIADYLGCSVDYLLGRTDVSSIPLSSHESRCIEAMRMHPEMQEAVNRLLGLSDDKKVITPKLKDPTALVAAKGGGIKNSPSEDDGEGITM